MKPLHAIAIVILVAVLATSCAGPDASALRVVSPLPSGVLGRDAVLQLTFSRGVVPRDSVNHWTDAPYIEFSPAIPGKFVWDDTAHLVFSPDNKLAGDTKYVATLNTSLLKERSGAKGFAGTEEFAFETPGFTMRSAEFFYDRIGEKREVGIKANLEFTYLVNPQDVAQHLHVTVDKQQQSITRVVTTENSATIAVEIGTTTQLERERAIEIGFSTDLVSPETGTHIKMEKPFTYTLPPLGEVSIYGHEFGTDGTTSWIRVKTSQEIDPNVVKSFVSIDPVRPFTVRNDGDGFTLQGKFEPGTTFRLVIKKGMESVLGGKTTNEYDAEVVIGDVAPSFGFVSSSGLYMLLGGRKTIEIKTINMPRLAVRVSQIFQNNLVFFLEGGRYYDYSYDESDESSGRSSTRKYRYNVGNYGKQMSFDTITVAGPANREVTTQLELARYMNTGYRGFYLVEIADPAQGWRSTSKLISISNIGLIVKESIDEVTVFATSLQTTDPMSGVMINLVSTTNQMIATAKTDGDGVARFANYHATAREFTLQLVTGEVEGDFNFINLEDYRVETSRFDVAGKHESQTVYDALLYGDRNVYRPGEKVILSGIVRDLSNALPANMPVRLRIVNPRGTTVQDMQLTLNTDGAFETSFPTQATALTGDYRCELSTGNNLYLTSYKISVEDFVPDRLRVTVHASSESAQPGETVRYDVTAVNFFGPPAAGRTWEFEGSFDAIPYMSKAFPGYRFADDAAAAYSGDPLVCNGKTDQEGKAVIEFPLPEKLTAGGILRARGRVAVFDESGRPVYQLAQTLVHPKPYHIGIVNRGAYYISPNSPQKVQIVAVDTQDKLIKGFRARIDVIRQEWHSVLRQHQETRTLRYVSERRDIIVRSDRVTIGDGPIDYMYSAPRSGDYVVRISKDGDGGYNQFGFYSYSWGTSDITSFEIDPEARVEVVLDKTTYAPGDRAHVLFQTPFSGKLLVTVERNQVYSYRYLDVVNNAATMEIPVEDRFLPNVYISAVLFRKVTDLSIPLLAGHGFAPLMVEKKSNKLDVQIQAPEKIRPNTRQRITVHAGGERDVAVTLAAVDEGICQVKNYKTPDPYAYFYARKALETETADFFKHLLPEPAKGKQQSSPGGGEAEMGLRANPLGVQRFKPLAIWSGILKTGSGGSVEVPLDIPEFNGEVRLMAIAYKGDRFGSSQKAMKVSDPVVLTAALPRFLSPGDSLAMSITAFNTTEKPATLAFKVTTTEGLAVAAKPNTLEVGANEERFVVAGIRASNRVGKETVTVRTEAFGAPLVTTTDLPVRPTAPYATDATTGYIDGGKQVTHAVEDVYLPYGRRAHIALSPYPVVGFSKQLQSLLGYPHGCLEQTVSKAFPQIYLRDIAVVLAPSALKTGSPTYFVNEAITKLASMQLYDGSFAFWPGGATSNSWGTVYATHFLVEARKAGYAVMDNVLKSAREAVARIARDKKTEDYYHYDRNRTVVTRIADKSCVYALYVLALAGAPERPVMDFYRTERQLLTNDTRYLLAGAYALSGDRKTYTDLIPAQFATEQPVRNTGGNFDSPVRAGAIMLNVLLETDLNNANIPRLTEYLARAYQPDEWYSTQDNAMSLLAFGKAARLASGANVRGKVTVGGKEYAYGGGTQKIDIEPYGKKVTIVMEGSGRVYYSLVVEGIRTDGKVRVEDKNLQVRRDLLDRTGTPVSLSGVRQNDLLVVRLTLTSSVDLLEHVAITDLLPAGFEIENPRLTETTSYAFIKNPAQPEYLDLRDDRVNIYTSFRRGPRQQIFFYAVRAVSPGTFQYPPVVAEAMYDGYYYSASGGGTLRVAR
jgi:alpha-2-macroglobulin